MAAGISSHINIRSAAPSVMRQDEAAIGTVQVYKRALNKAYTACCNVTRMLPLRRTESQEQ